MYNISNSEFVKVLAKILWVSDHLLIIYQSVRCIFHWCLIILFFTHLHIQGPNRFKIPSCTYFISGLMMIKIYICIYNKGSCNCLYYFFFFFFRILGVCNFVRAYVYRLGRMLFGHWSATCTLISVSMVVQCMQYRIFFFIFILIYLLFFLFLWRIVDLELSEIRMHAVCTLVCHMYLDPCLFLS